MRHPPALSIVSITYNDPPALEKTLHSLRALSLTEIAWEHVIVDSSPEKNRATLDQAQAGLPIVHISQPPNGIYAAMNEGIRRSTGEFIWFLNGGDKLSSSENLCFVVRELKEHADFEMALGRAELFREGRATYPQRPRTGILPLLGINRICHQALLFRRSTFERCGMFSEEYRLASDYELLLRAHAAGIKVLPVDKSIVEYDMGGQSSQTDQVLSEFRQVHENLSREGKLSWQWLHRISLRLERARICTFKWLAATPVGPRLKTAWYRWRRD